MSTDKINQLFWLYYGQAIKDKTGANFGSTGAFFLATEAQKCPVAGDDIPDEYTYQGLYDIGNNLLATDSLFYNPSALHGYDEALGTFLNWVDLGSMPDSGLDSALLSALKDQAGIQNQYKTQRSKAAEQYKEDNELGLVPGMNFYDYVASGKAPGFAAASTELANIGSTIQAIQSKIAGPMAATVNNDRALLAKGQDELKDWPGFNMHGIMGNALSPKELLQKFNLNEKVPLPPFQRLPAYNATTYKQAVQAAMRKAGGDYKPTNSISFTIDTGKSTSDFQFGQTTAGANVGVSYGGWFSFNASGDHSSKSSTLETGGESSKVDVKITYDTIQLIPITPGSWNIDVSKYKLRKEAPKDVKTLARVTQLVLATRIGYEITVGSSTASSIDSKMKETTSAGGSVSVFGIPISLGGSGSHTSEHNTHNATWDNASKTFTVKPANDVGFATIVGVVGEKFSIL